MCTTEFFEAIRAGNSATVSALLEADASLAFAKNDSGVSAVLMSVYTGRREIRDLLLSRGAALQIHEAVAVGNVDRVKQFVEKDSSIARSFSPDGFPVVALAAVFGYLEIARYLATQGADINAPATNGSGYNALTGAVANGHTEIVKWLLETGADPNYRYGPGYSPLLTAAANGHLEIVKLVLAHGADLRAVTNDGRSALALASERNHPAVAEHLQSIAV
ncbi:MAG TPA: ankyrin repeat domain-containing protein [Candidatus Acidoferrales bacterium]|jgi:ankyrin repeat protein|nr:ankyrin repeat domain-containing protein [Candidatus Acidoferrales bacterium]